MRALRERDFTTVFAMAHNEGISYRIAGTRPTASATLAAAVAARAYALNHQSEQARQALADADALMERLPEGERSDTWLTYGEQKHHVHLSHRCPRRWCRWRPAGAG